MKTPQWVATLFLVTGFSASSFAQIAGHVTLDGKPPKMPTVGGLANDAVCSKMHKDAVKEERVVADDDGNLCNVVISIKPAAGQKIPVDVPKTPAVLDQKGCVYHPHVIACMVGQPVTVKSEDSCSHNVHTTCIDNAAVNFSQGLHGEKKLDPFTAVETFKVKCDIHPWMAAWIRVLDNPYFAVTDEDGKYSIDTAGLPDGDYALVFWQETYQEREKQVTLKNGKATVDFSFKPGTETAVK